MEQARAWSAKASQIVPELTVLGALGDAPGWLVKIDIEPTATSLAAIETALKQLGVTAWHWEIHRGQVKARVYTRAPSGAASAIALPVLFVLVVALAAALALYYYDILDLESIAHLWPY